MAQSFLLGGLNGVVLQSEIQKELLAAGPQSAGIASAYVTVTGIQDIREVLRRAKVKECRLIAGTDDEITHPEAIRMAMEWNWQVRTGKAAAGRFHPKLIVAGKAFDERGDVTDPAFVYLGSGNITRPGLSRNTEAALLARAPDVVSVTDVLFGPLWRAAEPVTEAGLKAYEARFAERCRIRRPDVLTALGVADVEDIESVDTARLRTVPTPTRRAVATSFAAASWTGLQSFTGEYRFQIEFPRSAGEVVRRLAGALPGDTVDVFCEDGQIHSMTYRFYHDNGMFRLNVPNTVPGVQWARANRDGIAVLERGPEGGAPLRLRILKPGNEMTEVMARSFALGTWDRTRTRPYGWY